MTPIQEPANYYSVLGVEASASASEIRGAYLAKAKRAHPDKIGGSNEAFQQLADAFETLSCPLRRSFYDEERQRWEMNNAIEAVPSSTKRQTKCDWHSRDRQDPLWRVRLAVEELRSALQCLEPAQRRRVVQEGLPKTVRKTLLRFMEEDARMASGRSGAEPRVEISTKVKNATEEPARQAPPPRTRRKAGST